MNISKVEINNNIKKIIKNKQYLIILQGIRGSCYNIFAFEFMKAFIQSGHSKLCCHSPEDFFTPEKQSFAYKTNMYSDALLNCKKNILQSLCDGNSVIFNHTNLEENKFNDLISECKKRNICVIIFRFFPKMTEEHCANYAKLWFPYTQSSCVKQSIINDNVKLLNYKNFNKLTIFGIKCSEEIINNNVILSFTQSSSSLDKLKNLYIEKNLYKNNDENSNKKICALENKISELQNKMGEMMTLLSEIKINDTIHNRKIVSVKKEEKEDDNESKKKRFRNEN